MLEALAACEVSLVDGISDGISVAESAMVSEKSSGVIRTHFLPFLLILLLETALTGRVAHGVLRRTFGGSSSIISASVWLLPVPAAPNISALMLRDSMWPCFIASSKMCCDRAEMV